MKWKILICTSMHHLNRCVSSVLLLLCLSTSLLGQYTKEISGVILGEEVMFASILLESGETVALSDENGEFTFLLDTAIGDFKIIVRSIGYEDLILSVAEDNVFFECHLTPKVYDLHPVEVTPGSLPKDYKPQQLLRAARRFLDDQFADAKDTITLFGECRLIKDSIVISAGTDLGTYMHYSRENRFSFETLQMQYWGGYYYGMPFDSTPSIDHQFTWMGYQFSDLYNRVNLEHRFMTDFIFSPAKFTYQIGAVIPSDKGDQVLLRFFSKSGRSKFGEVLINVKSGMVVHYKVMGEDGIDKSARSESESYYEFRSGKTTAIRGFYRLVVPSEQLVVERSWRSVEVVSGEVDVKQVYLSEIGRHIEPVSTLAELGIKTEILRSRTY